MKTFIIGALFAAIASVAIAAEWPWPNCPTSPDPEKDLYRPPVIMFSAAMKFSDKSIASFGRGICRDTGVTLFWSWTIHECNGPCIAATTPATMPDWFPRDVPFSCEGCIFPHRERPSR